MAGFVNDWMVPPDGPSLRPGETTLRESPGDGAPEANSFTPWQASEQKACRNQWVATVGATIPSNSARICDESVN